MPNRKALLVLASADKDPHHPRVTVELLTVLLQESGLEVTAARTADDVTDQALAGSDLVVLWELLGDGCERACRSLCAAVSTGKPLLAIHTAVWSTTATQVPSDFLGGVFKTHPPFQAFRVHVAAPDHPVMAGVADFEITDEAYQIEACGDLDILAYFDGAELHDPGTQADWLRAHRRAPLVYAKAYGRGRIVNNALGHDDAAIAHPAFRRITRQAVGWLLAG